MTKIPVPPEDRYTHLRTHAAVQKQNTVERLKQAILQLEAEGRLVNTFTIKEVSGLNYMTYYRNREAFTLFQQHSTHLTKERAKEHAKQGVPRHGARRKRPRQEEVPHEGKVAPRDPLLDYKRPRLIALLHEARAERDEIKAQTQTDHAALERRYQALLQEHMQCGLKIARLEAELAEFQAFMERFRSSLRREEQQP